MSKPSFIERLQGRFDGYVRLEDARKLGGLIAENDDWYLLEPGQELPTETVPGAIAHAHLDALMDEIILEERGRWSTMIYAQSFQDPQIIKVFHPRRAGCGCGPASNIKPWWILTRIPPERVPEWEEADICATPKSPKGKPWWKRAS